MLLLALVHGDHNWKNGGEMFATLSNPVGRNRRAWRAVPLAPSRWERRRPSTRPPTGRDTCANAFPRKTRLVFPSVANRSSEMRLGEEPAMSDERRRKNSGEALRSDRSGTTGLDRPRVPYEPPPKTDSSTPLADSSSERTTTNSSLPRFDLTAFPQKLRSSIRALQPSTVSR